MEIEFKNKKTEKICISWMFFGEKRMDKELTKRLIELQEAINLLDIKKMRNSNLHPLKWERRFELVIDINGKRNPYRLIFETLNWENVCLDFYNDNKFKTVTRIKIIEISNHYK